MSAAAKSVFYFGFYLYLVGLTLVFAPNFLLSTLGMPATNEVWIRIVGVLVFCIGYYYHLAGRDNNRSFFKSTIPTRVLVFISFVGFVLAKLVSPVLIVFGVVDLLGAMWTWSVLRKNHG